MSANPFSLWVYLSQSPLLWLTVTLLVYATTDALSLVTHRHPLANPVLHSIWIIGAFLMLTGTSYTTYFGGAQFVHFLLGPATVALAVPLYENRKGGSRRSNPPARCLAALVVGSVTAVVSVVLLAEAVGLPRAVVLSLAPKSVTAGRRDGHQRIVARRSIADGGRGRPYRHHGRDHRHAIDEPDRHCGFPRARIRGRNRGAWHRHRSRVPG